MAKLTWTIETSTGTVSHDSPVTSDANMARFIDFLWTNWPQMEVDSDGIETPVSRTPAAEVQCFRDWADLQWLNTKQEVLEFERMVAKQAAAEGITWE